jgi:Flp pilus assembly protein CpaB
MILVAAVLIGVVAAFGLYQYVQKVQEDAKPNPVEVYVLSAEVKRGTPFSQAQASITKKTIPAEFRPANFVASLDQLANKVAVTNLAANQVLVEDMFVNADVATTSVRDRLDQRYVAVALPIDGVRAVGGLLQPGDEVNILVTPDGVTDVRVPEPQGSSNSFSVTAQGDLTPYIKSARYLYQKVRILSIGNDVRPLPGEPVKESDGTTTSSNNGSSGTIVFEVPAEIAQRLVSIDPSNIYLTLVAETWKPTPLAPIPNDELATNKPLPGEDGNALTPYGPAGYTPQPDN